MSYTVAGHRVTVSWMIAAVGIIAASIVVAVVTGTSGWFVALGLIGPDLTFLVAIGQPPPGPGRMPSRAIPFYNAAHRISGPVIFGAGTLLALWMPALGATIAVIALSWLGHVVWDRSVGYGLRDRDGAIIPPRALP